MKILSQQEFEQLNEKERFQYEERLKYYRDYHNTIETAKKDGFEEGFKKGQKEISIKVAKRMIRLGFDNESIAEITDLTLEEIEKFKKLLFKPMKNQ